MTTKTFAGICVAVLLFLGVNATGVGPVTTIARAQSSTRDADGGDSRVQQGFAINPVELNLAGKNRALVGVGSYIVNGAAQCDGCHNPGPGNNSWLPGNDPFFGQPAVVNPVGYMGGGRDFQTLGQTHIITRNITPDINGLPGGRTYEEFRLIMTTGVDLDHIHPPCTGAPAPGCIPAPNDGNLLLGMPWPYFQYLTEYELRAIYEYLTAIPCVPGPPRPSLLHNDCP